MVSTTRRRRPALVALVIVAAAGCLALSWWQWTRFESAPTTFPPPPAEYTVTEIPAGLLPERPQPTTQSDDDPALREYNAYLADLAKEDNEGRTNT